MRDCGVERLTSAPQPVSDGPMKHAFAFALTATTTTCHGGPSGWFMR